MQDITILRELIKDDAKVHLIDKFGKKSVLLTEPQYPASKVKISGMPDNAIVIKADTFKSLGAVFAGSKGECKCADYVIVADTETKKRIICIEIKAKKDSEKVIKEQLTGAKCFVVYCQEIGKLFWKHSTFLDGYTYRFISVGHTSISKRPTRIDPAKGGHNSPERMLKISSPSYLTFDVLAGKS